MAFLFPPESVDGDGFTIRCYRPGDGPALREATTSSYDHLRPWMPWATREQTDAQAERLAREFRARWLLEEDFVLAIVSASETPGTGRLLGGTGFHLREGPVKYLSADVGMWIRTDAAGQGLGTAALRTMLEWGFTEWPWMRLTWRCDVTNLASARVAEKCGMVREGILRSHGPSPDGKRRPDMALYAALRHEWLIAAGIVTELPDRP